MTVTVSTTSIIPNDVSNAALQAQIAAVQLLVTAATNKAQVAGLIVQLDSLQQQLVMNLMSNKLAGSQVGGAPGYIAAATVLSTLSINT